MAKGSAIALMVFGHTFSTYQNTPIMVWIYSFHMPLFFLTTGILYGVKEKKRSRPSDHEQTKTGWLSGLHYPDLFPRPRLSTLKKNNGLMLQFFQKTRREISSASPNTIRHITDSIINKAAKGFENAASIFHRTSAMTILPPHETTTNQK